MRTIKILILTLIMLFSISFSSFAIAIPNDPVSEISYSGEVEPRVEQTRWYYRTVNGVTEKRLWSLTYGVWLTDWMPVNTEPVT